MPVLPGAGASGVPSTGKVFFVDSGSGSDNHGGRSPKRAFATLDKAIGMCTASSGDVIYVMEGHAETIASATACVVDVVGVKIIGLGSGRARPTFTLSATTSIIAMSADDCSIENCVFVAGVSAIVKGIFVTGDDCTVANCEFNFSTTAYDFIRCIDVASANRVTVTGNVLIAENAVVGAGSGIAVHDSDDAVIQGNSFSGNFGSACVNVLGTVTHNIYISNNRGRNDDKTAGRGVYIAVASGGLIEFNRFVTAYTGPKDDTIDPGLCGCIENYVAATDSTDEAGVRIPFEGGESGWQVAYADCTAFKGETANGRGNDAGTKDPYPIFHVKGLVECQVYGICTTTLLGDTATISVGVTGATGLFVAKLTATDIDAGQAVHGAFHQTGLNATAMYKVVREGSISEYTHGDNVGTGYLDYVCRWRPLMAGSNVDSVA